jgi:hypothetical protein
MGLDMFLYGRQITSFDSDETLDGKKLIASEVDLGYWRKHPNLHGYIVDTFADGKDECQRIELGSDSIRQIIEAIKTEKLPHTEGFFFGTSNNSEEQKAADIKVFEEALAWADNSDRYRYVIYQASW